MSTTFLRKYASRTINSTKSKPKGCEITHLYMNGKGLKEIKISESCLNLKVLYLHDNRIQRISNLEIFQNITHLYLQWNRIEKIENLNGLRNLQKLFLGFNAIRRLENLAGLQRLQELHIEKQNIGEIEFSFDFYTLKSLARTLQVLNISKLNLTSLEPISILIKLNHLIATENCFNDARELGVVLGRILFLERADLESCPAQKDIHFREKITAGSYNLQYLNGKFITNYNRAFIKRFEKVKSERRTKSETDTKYAERTKNADNSKSKKLKAVRSLDLKSMEEIGYRAWNSLSFTKKPLIRPLKKTKVHFKPKSDYPLQGRPLVNE